MFSRGVSSEYMSIYQFLADVDVGVPGVGSGGRASNSKCISVFDVPSTNRQTLMARSTGSVDRYLIGIRLLGGLLRAIDRHLGRIALRGGLFHAIDRDLGRILACGRLLWMQGSAYPPPRFVKSPLLFTGQRRLSRSGSLP